MAEEIMSYREMCDKEKTSLQKGINFNLGDMHSIVLMSRAPNAPYDDEFKENNTVLIYEGHDVSQTGGINTKSINQPERTSKGTLTHNGKFHEAAQQFKIGDRTVEQVKVYENLQGGTWIDHGVFFLTDSWIENNGTRNVFKFKLVATDENQIAVKVDNNIPLRKVIPSSIMTKVLEKNGRKCNECGSQDKLKFIHTGTDSITSDNVSILCDKHRIQNN